jgi:hypothetical protein
VPTLLLGAGATVASCTAEAQRRGYAFAGLAFGGSCYGSTTLSATRQSESLCSTPCSADPTQVCGGPSTTNVLALGSSVCPYGPNDWGSCN